MNNLKLMEFMGKDAAMLWVIDNMQIKLDKYIEKNPDKDVKHQKATIGVLRAYREDCLEIYQTEKIMTKKYLEMAKKVDLLQTINTENAKLIKNLKGGL